MNKNDTKKIMAYLREAFPNGKPGTELTVMVWHDLLKDYDVEIVEEAARNVVRTWDGYTMPPPAYLIGEIKRLMPEDETAIELWRIAEKAIKRGSVLTEEEFAALPSPVRRYFGGRSAIRDLALLDADQLPNERARFLKHIEIIKKSEDVLRNLPEALTKMIEYRKLDNDDKEENE